LQVNVLQAISGKDLLLCTVLLAFQACFALIPSPAVDIDGLPSLLCKTDLLLSNPAPDVSETAFDIAC